jgi:hypothetical protein
MSLINYSEKLFNLNYLPLDLPYAKSDSDLIKYYMDKNGKRTNYTWTKQINDPWNHIVVRIPNTKSDFGEKPGSRWRSDFRNMFPDVIKVVEMMPYDKINYVYILEQLIEVSPHFDYASKNPMEHMEPATYRISLLMEDTESFYICNDSDCTSTTIPVFPVETNSWVFSNRFNKHGSLMPKNNKRKILLAIGGDINENEHYDMLSKSYDKYSEYSF